MARTLQIIEIDLNGSTFHLDVGGCIAFRERTFTEDAADVALIRVNTLQEAERLETLASAFHATFRWMQASHRRERERAISVDDFEKKVAADPKRFLPEAARERLGFKGPHEVEALRRD